MLKLIKFGFAACMLLFIGNHVELHAQDFSRNEQKDMEKAQLFLESDDPHKAIRIYKNLLGNHENDTSLMLAIARAYSAASEHDKSLYWLGEMVENPEIHLNESLIRFYVYELQMAGRYEIAKIWLEKIKLDLNNHSDTINTNAIVFFEDTAYINITSLDFNTEESEFCPVFYKSSMLFYSNRGKESGNPINLAGDAAADLYNVSLMNNASVGKPRLFNELMGYGHYEGSFAFYNGFEQSILSKYLTNGNDLPTGENKLSGLRLYSAMVDTNNNMIDYFNPLPFNIHGYSVAHPNISEDGQVLFFASNIPGGYGGSDIYRSQYENGTWSPPENLGPSVNSAYDEYFPYNYKNHTLFFTSNRPGGVGKFDMYKQNLQTQESGANPLNLGIPVNSTEDDYCLIVTSNGKSGFFTSNRADSKGKEDIFRFDLKTVSIQQVIDEILADDAFHHVQVSAGRKSTIIVEPLNDSGKHEKHTLKNHGITDVSHHSENANSMHDETLPDIQLTLENPKHNSVNDVELADQPSSFQQVQILIRNKGKTIFQSSLPEDLNLATFFDVKHEIKQSLGQLETNHGSITEEESREIQRVDNHIFRVQIAASKKPISNTRLKQMYSGNRDIFEFKEEGWFKYAIGDFKNYFIAAKVKETSGINDAFIAAYDGEKKKPLMHAIEKSHFFETLPVLISPDKIMKRAEIYFPYNEIEIAESMRLQLDELVIELQAESNLRVSINGYTDYFGSDRFNLALAGERARSVKNYFQSQGISQDRIRIVSEGKTLTNSDEPDVLLYSRSKEASNRKAELVLYEPQ